MIANSCRWCYDVAIKSIICACSFRCTIKAPRWSDLGAFSLCVRLTHQCRCSLSASCNTPSNHSQIKRPRTLPKTARQKSIILCMFSPPLGATAHYYHKHHARGGQGSGSRRTCVALDGLAPLSCSPASRHPSHCPHAPPRGGLFTFSFIIIDTRYSYFCVIIANSYYI